jgi:hypothetical protein
VGELLGHHEDFAIAVMHAWVDSEPSMAGQAIDQSLRRYNLGWGVRRGHWTCLGARDMPLRSLVLGLRPLTKKRGKCESEVGCISAGALSPSMHVPSATGGGGDRLD